CRLDTISPDRIALERSPQGFSPTREPGLHQIDREVSRTKSGHFVNLAVALRDLFRPATDHVPIALPIGGTFGVDEQDPRGFVEPKSLSKLGVRGSSKKACETSPTAFARQDDRILAGRLGQVLHGGGRILFFQGHEAIGRPGEYLPGDERRL